MLTEAERHELAQPGGPVSFVERTDQAKAPSEDIAAIARAAPWIRHHVIPHQGNLPRRLTVIGSVVEEILFLGGVFGAMLHTLVTFAVELSRNAPALVDSRTSALMTELRRCRFVSIVAAPDCEESVALTQAALRLIQLSSYVKLAIVTPESSARFGQGKTPALLIEGELVASGLLDEHALAELIVRPR